MSVGAVCLLQGCGDASGSDTAVNENVVTVSRNATTSGGVIDPKLYAGQVQFKIEDEVVLREQNVPFTVYAGLE